MYRLVKPTMVFSSCSVKLNSLVLYLVALLVLCLLVVVQLSLLVAGIVESILINLIISWLLFCFFFFLAGWIDYRYDLYEFSSSSSLSVWYLLLTFGLLSLVWFLLSYFLLIEYLVGVILVKILFEPSAATFLFLVGVTEALIVGRAPLFCILIII